jgi:hypothetical protein
MKMLHSLKLFAPACCLLLLVFQLSLAQGNPKREVETEFHGCDFELLHLDNLFLALQDNPAMRAHVIVYAPRVGSRANTASAFGARMKKYLVVSRKLDGDRLTVVDGGFREKLSYEIWLVPEGAETPSPKPTVSRKRVKLRRGRTRLRSCGEILG